MTQPTTINLGNMGSEEQANRVAEKLNGKTFYNFQVETSPYMGNWPVQVTTFYPNTDEQEFKDMVLFVLACEV